MPRFTVPVVVLLFLFAFSQTSFAQCGNKFFNGQCSLGNPCVVAYTGSCTPNLNNPCQVPYVYHMASGNGYIVLGPLPAANPISFEYETNNPQQIHVTVSLGPDPNGTWAPATSVDLSGPPSSFFPTNINTCLSAGPWNIPAGYYYKINQVNGSNPNGNGNINIWNLGGDGNVPVQLTSFVGNWNGSRVQLSWRTATEINNSGFEVQRSIEQNSWEAVGFVVGHGTVNTPQTYSFTDLPPIGIEGVSYRLKQIDRDGTVDYSPVVTVSTTTIMKSLRFLNVAPNPFNPSTTLSYSVPNASNLSLVIVDHTGRFVARVIDNVEVGAGSYSQLFQADHLPSGRYFAWLYTSTESAVIPLHLVK